MLIDPIDLKTILTNIQPVTPSYLSLPIDPGNSIWSFYEFLEIHSLIFNTTLIISLIFSIVDSTFHLQLHHIQTIPMVNMTVHKTFNIELKINYLAMTNDKKYFIYPIDMDIMKCLVSKGHYCSLSDGLYPIYNHIDCALPLCFKNGIQIKCFCPMSMNNITLNFIAQLNPNQYLLAVIKRSPIECRCPRNTETISFHPH